MAGTRFATRYAKALIDLAKELNQMDAVRDDMMTIQSAIKVSRDLRNFLQSPVVKPAEKIKGLQAVFASTTDLTQKLLKLVVRHGREGGLNHIASGYLTRYNKANGIVEARVVTASPLSEAQRNNLQQRFAATGAKETSLKEVVNPDVIGGLVVRVGDLQVDATIAAALNRIDQHFKKNSYIADF